MCESMYGEKAATSILNVGETRWNSTQPCFASHLRITSACRIFAQINTSNIPAEWKFGEMKTFG
jgi:hypothetical protein